MILARRLILGAFSLEQGYQIITTTSGTWNVPAGVTEIAAMAIGRGGPGRTSTFSPFNGGGGGAVAYSNSISVTPGELLRIGTQTVLASDGQNGERIELRRSDNTTVIIGAMGGTGATGTGHGVGGTGGNSIGDSRVGGTDGINTNRGGSSAKPGGPTSNPTNNTPGYGITLDDGFWSYAHQSGYGRGGTTDNPAANDFGLRAIVISWGPGHGFSSGSSSYWAL